MDEIPDYSLRSDSYDLIRPFFPGDELKWTYIQYKAAGYEQPNFYLFNKEFGSAPEFNMKNQLYLCNKDNFDPIGTITAFKNRIHWVAVLPEFQGKGFGNRLMYAALKLMVEQDHDDSWLSTYDNRRPAIDLYKRFGFRIESRIPSS